MGNAYLQWDQTGFLLTLSIQEIHKGFKKRLNCFMMLDQTLFAAGAEMCMKAMNFILFAINTALWYGRTLQWAVQFIRRKKSFTIC